LTVDTYITFVSERQSLTKVSAPNALTLKRI